MRPIDIFALIFSFIVAVILSTVVRRKVATQASPIAAFFMFFGPSTILVHMACHIGQISFNAIKQVSNGSFHYDFRFYSLMLMAVAIIYGTVLLLARVKKFLEGDSLSPIFYSVGMIVVVSAPTIPFTPIGSLPTLACLITLAALPFAKRKKRIVVPRRYPRALKSNIKEAESISVLRFV